MVCLILWHLAKQPEQLAQHRGALLALFMEQVIPSVGFRAWPKPRVEDVAEKAYPYALSMRLWV